METEETALDYNKRITAYASYHSTNLCETIYNNESSLTSIGYNHNQLKAEPKDRSLIKFIKRKFNKALIFKQRPIVKQTKTKPQKKITNLINCSSELQTAELSDTNMNQLVNKVHALLIENQNKHLIKTCPAKQYHTKSSNNQIDSFSKKCENNYYSNELPLLTPVTTVCNSVNSSIVQSQTIPHNFFTIHEDNINIDTEHSNDFTNESDRIFKRPTTIFQREHNASNNFEKVSDSYQKNLDEDYVVNEDVLSTILNKFLKDITPILKMSFITFLTDTLNSHGNIGQHYTKCSSVTPISEITKELLTKPKQNSKTNQSYRHEESKSSEIDYVSVDVIMELNKTLSVNDTKYELNEQSSPPHILINKTTDQNTILNKSKVYGTSTNFEQHETIETAEAFAEHVHCPAISLDKISTEENSSTKTHLNRSLISPCNRKKEIINQVITRLKNNKNRKGKRHRKEILNTKISHSDNRARYSNPFPSKVDKTPPTIDFNEKEDIRLIQNTDSKTSRNILCENDCSIKLPVVQNNLTKVSSQNNIPQSSQIVHTNSVCISSNVSFDKTDPPKRQVKNKWIKEELSSKYKRKSRKKLNSTNQHITFNISKDVESTHKKPIELKHEDQFVDEIKLQNCSDAVNGLIKQRFLCENLNKKQKDVSKKGDRSSYDSTDQFLSNYIQSNKSKSYTIPSDKKAPRKRKPKFHLFDNYATSISDTSVDPSSIEPTSYLKSIEKVHSPPSELSSRH